MKIMSTYWDCAGLNKNGCPMFTSHVSTLDISGRVVTNTIRDPTSWDTMRVDVDKVNKRLLQIESGYVYRY